jgi:hypothetical protein
VVKRELADRSSRGRRLSIDRSRQFSFHLTLTLSSCYDYGKSSLPSCWQLMTITYTITRTTMTHRDVGLMNSLFFISLTEK